MNIARLALACALLIALVSLNSPSPAMAQQALDNIGPQPGGLVAAPVVGAETIEATSSAHVDYDPVADAFLVVKKALPAAPILDVYLFSSGGFPVDARSVELQTHSTTFVVQLDVDDPDPVVGWFEVPFAIGDTHAFALKDAMGVVLASSGWLDLGSPDTAAVANGCVVGETVAFESDAFKNYGFREDGIDTTAKDLGKIEWTSDWSYYGVDTSGTPSTQVFKVPKLYQFGHGWYGMNQYQVQHVGTIAAGQGMKGYSQTYEVNLGPPCGIHKVGVRAYVSTPKLMYFDLASEGIIFEHLEAKDRHSPATSCSTTLYALSATLKAALALTKSYGKFSAVIPDDYCEKNWSEIHSAMKHTGMGIAPEQLSSGSYKGSESYVRTRYDSTGYFRMHFGGSVKADLWFRACPRCDYHSEIITFNVDGTTGKGPWSVARVV